MGYDSRSKTNPDLRRRLEEKILRQMRLVAEKPSLSTEEVINLMDKLGSRAQDLSACLEADDKFLESVLLYLKVAQTFTTAIPKAPAIYRRPLEILERFWKISAESKQAAVRKLKRSASVAAKPGVPVKEVPKPSVSKSSRKRKPLTTANSTPQKRFKRSASATAPLGLLGKEVPKPSPSKSSRRRKSLTTANST
jgi:hypothetical protein